MITIDPYSQVPIFTQLHDRIVEAVALGELTPGTRLASVRAVAEEFGINPATVKKAYDQLKQEGVVVTHPREGTTIAAARATRRTREQLSAQLTTVLALGRAQGLSPQQLAAECTEILSTFE
ncbi:GntR family transcriptional regulator [Corynebacterium sp. 13CS0277]|uniref:GntR family transcriptional regulator n=1 Tax=Corynebacterium sp. 13CS0277 TaxID=2071994 RepID=UPI000D042F16|nr:GntR family transcriptional regulator [Corynebacterium sp. 13CS0277]PRQ11817.1 GntR family transcriptional regulator [Corynebacterium sp. 13CS0277]